jgi:hypothetical protein
MHDSTVARPLQDACEAESSLHAPIRPDSGEDVCQMHDLDELSEVAGW